MHKRNLLLTLVAGLFAQSLTIVEGGGGGAAEVVDIESLMDMSIGDLKDLPGFEVPPKGHYKLNVSLERKKVNDKDGIEAKCTVLETLELANTADTAVADGTKFGQLFFMDNEWGQGGFKGFALPIATALGFTSVRAAVDGIQNVTIAATLGHRYHKEDKAKPIGDRRTYADLKNIEVL